MIDKEEFLETVFSELNEGEYVCLARALPYSDDPAKTWFKSFLEENRAFTKWKPEKQAQAVYYCVSTITSALNEKGTMVSRKRKDLVRYHVIVLDDILQKTGEPPVEPSYKMETSPGSFQYGYLLEPGTDFENYEAVVQAIHERGFGDPGAGGSFRLVRVVGSANLKPGRNEFRSHITEWSPDNIWTLATLAADFGLDINKLPVKSATRGVKTSITVTPGMPVDDTDILLQWLIKNGHVVKDDGGDWVDVKCPNHEEHTTGGDVGHYSPLGRGGPDWAMTRAWSCKHGHCAGHKFKHFMKAMAELGAPRVSGLDILPWLQAKYAYIVVGARVADLQQRSIGGIYLYDLEDWSKLHKGRVLVPGRDTPVEIKTAFLEHRKTKKVTDTKYWPVKAEDDTAIITSFGQEFVNNYTPPNHPYTTVDPDVFLDHIDFLLPDDTERDLFLDWLAHKIQNPDIRSYAMIMIAEDGYGVGRSWLRAMLEKVLQGKVASATLPQLIGKGTAAENNYNDWAVGCQLLVVEEAKDNMSKDDFYHGFESFKKNVDTRVTPVRVNPKYGRTRDDFMFFNALIFSNHSDALAIPSNDRRCCVLTNPSVMAGVEYYDRLEGGLSADEAARVYWYLMERDISGYDHVYPPMTKGKMLMTEQNILPSVEIKNHIVEHCEGQIFTKKMLKSKVITAAHALDYDSIAASPGGIIRTLWGKMGSLRDDPRGARYYIGGSQIEVRAISEKPKWEKHDFDRNKTLFEEELLKNDITGGKGLKLMK